MKCLNCQHENPDSKKFCRECGAKLLLRCPECEAEILPADKFCGECGHNVHLSSEPSPKNLSIDEKLEKIQKLVTEETFKLNEGLFIFEALRERKVKGKQNSVKTYQGIGTSSRRTRFDVNADRGLTPYVGRERELELLLDSFERAKAGRGQAVSLVAEAGAGKSRLLYEFRKSVSGENATFLEGRCVSYSRTVPYYPTIDILKANFNISDGDKDEAVRKNLIKAIEIFKECGADGWVEKYEKDLAAIL
jgi:hypothetical protein